MGRPVELKPQGLGTDSGLHSLSCLSWWTVDSSRWEALQGHLVQALYFTDEEARPREIKRMTTQLC